MTDIEAAEIRNKLQTAFKVLTSMIPVVSPGIARTAVNALGDCIDAIDAAAEPMMWETGDDGVFGVDDMYQAADNLLCMCETVMRGDEAHGRTLSPAERDGIRQAARNACIARDALFDAFDVLRVGE